MRFAYMVQSEGALPASFHEVRADPDVALFHLTFRDEAPDAIFLPGSTWTEGRNRLLEQARASGSAFDYFIFSDDDVGFAAGSWKGFQADLEAHRPAIGVPAFYDPDGCPDVHAVYDFDAIVTAFHRDVIEDGLVLPYIADFDADSWWLSQYFVIHLANALYPNGVVKLPRTAVTNIQHRAYPRIEADRFGDYDSAYFALWQDHDWARQRFRTHFLTRDDPPFPPALAESYRVLPDLRDRLKPRG